MTSLKKDHNKIKGLPPYGGSGLKCNAVSITRALVGSPSVWREWIEMCVLLSVALLRSSLPPCGGSGLKCTVTTSNSTGHIVSLRVEGVD